MAMSDWISVKEVPQPEPVVGTHFSVVSTTASAELLKLLKCILRRVGPFSRPVVLYMVVMVNAPQWYGAIFGAMLVGRLVGVALNRLYRHLVRGLHPLLLRHLVYHRVAPHAPLLEELTRLHLLVFGLLLIGNVLAIVLRAETRLGAASQLGSLSVINTVPLLVATRLSVSADLLDVSYRPMLTDAFCDNFARSFRFYWPDYLGDVSHKIYR